MSSSKITIRGTREWAVANIDCCTGCSHGCKYCYARYDAVTRSGVVTADEWLKPAIRPDDANRRYPLYPGQVMFPTTHDILPEILGECLTVLTSLLNAGNKVLVVSKPHFQCVSRICNEFRQYRDNLLFRFTITARDDTILSFWEPHAPVYAERRKCLQYAYTQGYATSLSIEPMLDSDDVAALVHELSPWVSHSIWIGKMNKALKRVDRSLPGMEKELARIIAGQTDERITSIYTQLKNNRLVRWKESIKEVVGLELPKKAGLDI